MVGLEKPLGNRIISYSYIEHKPYNFTTKKGIITNSNLYFIVVPYQALNTITGMYDIECFYKYKNERGKPEDNTYPLTSIIFDPYL